MATNLQDDPKVQALIAKAAAAEAKKTAAAEKKAEKDVKAAFKAAITGIKEVMGNALEVAKGDKPATGVLKEIQRQLITAVQEQQAALTETAE